MTDSTSKPGGPKVGADAGAVRNAGRRRLLQAGIAAAPIVMTVASRPVLATGGQNCQRPSGFSSANASNPGGATCTGHEPNWWKNNPGSWPSSGCTTTTKFKDKFSPNASGYGDKTCMQVLGMSASPPNDVAKCCVAALLNCLSGSTPTSILDVATIRDIWNEYMTRGGGTTGYYEPTSNVKWYNTHITTYFGTTMPY